MDAEQFRAIIAAAADYLQANQHRIRRDKANPAWNAERVTQTLVFHAVRGTLAIVWDQAGLSRRDDRTAGPAVPTIAGIGIAWQTDEQTVRERHEAHLAQFDWAESDPNGDSIYFALLVTSHPAAMRDLVAYFQKRFETTAATGGTPVPPLKLLAHRRGQLRDETGIMERITQAGSSRCDDRTAQRAVPTTIEKEIYG